MSLGLAQAHNPDAEDRRSEHVWMLQLLAAGVVILILIAIVGHNTHDDASHEQRSRRGYWGDVTSTIDWCESNYDVSQYTAEFWNTISNIFFVLFALWGMYLTWNGARGGGVHTHYCGKSFECAGKWLM